MKRSLLSFLIFISTSANMTQARLQEVINQPDSISDEISVSSAKKTDSMTKCQSMIIMSPVKLLLFYHINFYQRFGNNGVIGIGLQTPNDDYFNGYGFNVELRFHTSTTALKGFYIAPNISMNFLKYNPDPNSHLPETIDAGFNSAGIMIGWQWFLFDGFAVGLGFGADHYFITGKKKPMGATYRYFYTSTFEHFYNSFQGNNGNLFAFRFDLGFAW